MGEKAELAGIGCQLKRLIPRRFSRRRREAVMPRASNYF